MLDFALCEINTLSARRAPDLVNSVCTDRRKISADSARVRGRRGAAGWELCCGPAELVSALHAAPPPRHVAFGGQFAFVHFALKRGPGGSSCAERAQSPAVVHPGAPALPAFILKIPIPVLAELSPPLWHARKG